MSTKPKLAAGADAASLDDLTQMVLLLLAAGTMPNNIRATVDGAIDQAGADASDDNADPPGTPPAEQTAATFRFVHAGELLSVRLNARQMQTCKNNGLEPEKYARAVAKYKAGSKDASSWGIRRLPGGAR